MKQTAYLRHTITDGRQKLVAVYKDVAATVRRSQQVGKLKVHFDIMKALACYRASVSKVYRSDRSQVEVLANRIGCKRLLQRRLEKARSVFLNNNNKKTIKKSCGKPSYPWMPVQ